MKNLKLNKLEQNQLSAQDMHSINGGGDNCGCSCYYRDKGGSSIADNSTANILSGSISKEGEILIYTVACIVEEVSR